MGSKLKWYLGNLSVHVGINEDHIFGAIKNILDVFHGCCAEIAMYPKKRALSENTRWLR